MVRFKHRYVLAEIEFGSDLLIYNLVQQGRRNVLYAAVRDIVEQLHGSYGIGLLTPGLSVKYINEYTRMVMVRCRREHLKLLTSAIPFIKHLPESPCIALLIIRYSHNPYTVLSSSVKYINEYTRMVMVRCRREHLKLLTSAIPFIKHLPDGKGGQLPCFLRTLHVGGSIRACQKWLIQHNRQVLPTLLLRCTGEEEKSRMRKSIFDSNIVKEEPWTAGSTATTT